MSWRMERIGPIGRYPSGIVLRERTNVGYWVRKKVHGCNAANDTG